MKRLIVEALTVEFPGFRLGPVTLEFREGLHAVMGPNGSGKTTLLRAIAGLIRRSGRVYCCGVEVNRVNWHLVSHNLLDVPRGFRIRVYDAARLLLKPLLADEWLTVFKRMLTNAGVDWVLYRRWDELSAGQASLVKTLIALTRPTPIVLLDEPFEHLDVEWRCRLAELLQQQARSGRIVVVATHDFQTLHYFDTIIFVEKGKVERIASSVYELIDSLKKVYSVEFILLEGGGVTPTCSSIRAKAVDDTSLLVEGR